MIKVNINAGCSDIGVFLLVAALALAFFAGGGHAQEDYLNIPPISGQKLSADDVDIQSQNSRSKDITVSSPRESNPRYDRGRLVFYEKDVPDPREVPSLFFTPWTRSLIKEYRSRKEFITPGRSGNDDRVKRGARELALGGIAYHGKKDWTIWLNGLRVTPQALPEQIHDLRVTEEYVDIKWYDSYTNIIFPVRLRPHQRFNLDSRMFLPG
jgi:hypothetical protein